MGSKQYRWEMESRWSGGGLNRRCLVDAAAWAQWTRCLERVRNEMIHRDERQTGCPRLVHGLRRTDGVNSASAAVYFGT